MGYHHRLSTLTTITTYCIFAVLVFHISALCPTGVQYWDSERDTCVNCTKCKDLTPQIYVVIRPCAVHRDTQCGQISDLLRDSSWFLDNPKPRQPPTTSRHHHRHHSGSSNNEPPANNERHHRSHHKHQQYHHNHRHHHKNLTRHTVKPTNDELYGVVWNIAKPFDNNSGLDTKKPPQQQQRKHLINSDEDENVNNSDYVMNENNLVTNNLIHSSSGDGGFGKNSDRDDDDQKNVVNERLVWPVGTAAAAASNVLSNTDDIPFSNVETLVWDWQAIVLAMAVCACILFFLVAAAYSVHHARQWKRLKENFEAGKNFVNLVSIQELKMYLDSRVRSYR